MSATFTATCDACPWTGTYTSQKKADYAHRLHSCDRWRAKAAAARRGRARDAAVDRTPKPCLHKRTTHAHGTYSCYVLDGCRCAPCSKANSTYERTRVRQQAYGRWDGLVDAEPAREHLQQLRAAGMGIRTIAKRLDLAESTLAKIVYGDPRRGAPPSRRVKPSTLAAILAVTPDPADGACVDGTGTRRRLQALVATGWSQSRLARMLGWTVANLGRLVHRDGQVTHATARAVAALYDQHWQGPPEPADRWEATAITRAQQTARIHGWIVPMGWDDGDLDNPNARPRVHAAAPSDEADDLAVDLFLDGHRVTLRRPERVEVVRRLARHGLSDAQIADRLGVTARTVLRYRDEYRIPSTWAQVNAA